MSLRVLLGYSQKDFIRELNIRLLDFYVRQLLAEVVPPEEVDRIATTTTRLRFTRTLRPEDQAEVERWRRVLTLALLNQPTRQAAIAS
ncbi:MAG: hypothetical protein AAB686_02555 [Patescibacteria group bacterium]